jgi:uncharacterized membrane protein (DUF441 family)
MRTWVLIVGLAVGVVVGVLGGAGVYVSPQAAEARCVVSLSCS